MSNLSNLNITISCKEVSEISAWSNKLNVDLCGADVAEIITDYQEDILEWIDTYEVSKWLESKGYRVEEE